MEATQNLVWISSRNPSKNYHFNGNTKTPLMQTLFYCIHTLETYQDIQKTKETHLVESILM